ncbi:hypothetical protein [Cupriavidus sp. 2TAF22]|uniref:hypothetical protein n=1 Tax=Cupriavidus sp. 2TAF22 TaxID=3233010 RepID=UPI003F8DBFA2
MDTLRRHIGRILDPFGHLRQAKSFHALRVGLAVLASIGLTTGLKLPHGDWATITVLVQHPVNRFNNYQAVGTAPGA